MKELRPGSTGRSEIRVLFAFDLRRMAILLVGGDKSSDWSGWYVTNIPIADDHPFAVNDVEFARETGVAAEVLNPFGCSLVYGHPQGPTGASRRGGGIGLFTGCAAGDTGAAVVLAVDG